MLSPLLVEGFGLMRWMAPDHGSALVIADCVELGVQAALGAAGAAGKSPF